MTAAAEALPLWAWVALVGVCLIVAGVTLFLRAGFRQLDDALAAVGDEEEPVWYWPAGADYAQRESVEQYADRELQQFACPEMDLAEVERLRAVAAKQAAEARAPQPRGRI